MTQHFLVHSTNLKKCDGVQTWQEIQEPTPLNDEDKSHARIYISARAQLAAEYMFNRQTEEKGTPYLMETYQCSNSEPAAW